MGAIAEMRDSETKASLEEKRREEKRGRARERIDAELTSRSSEGWSGVGGGGGNGGRRRTKSC